jgi:excisionase family DNA binding protein
LPSSLDQVIVANLADRARKAHLARQVDNFARKAEYVDMVDLLEGRRTVRKLMGARSPDNEQRQFHSVAETARILGVSDMTLYRAIHDGQFPAVRIMGRLIVPARAIDSIVDTALENGELVDAAEWVPGSPGAPGERFDATVSPRRGVDRPRPGANQTGAGSPITQQGARGEVSSMTDDYTDRGRRSRVSRTRATAGGVA